MRTIYKTRESQVAIRGVEEELFQRVLHADACLSDLDDTDAASPAKSIALHNWRSRLWNDFGYLCWFVETGWHYLFNGNNAESERWRKYVDLFIKNKGGNTEALAQIDRLIDTSHITASLFPGVAEFYDLLPAKKYYVSRNIPLIVQKYGQHLGFRDTFGEVYDKAQFVEGFVREHVNFQHYAVRGDSKEDKEVLDILQSCVRSLRIKSVVGIFVAGNRTNPGFEIETSRNQTGLVELLKSHQAK